MQLYRNTHNAKLIKLYFMNAKLRLKLTCALSQQVGAQVNFMQPKLIIMKLIYSCIIESAHTIDASQADSKLI